MLQQNLDVRQRAFAIWGSDSEVRAQYHKDFSGFALACERVALGFDAAARLWNLNFTWRAEFRGNFADFAAYARAVEGGQTRDPRLAAALAAERTSGGAPAAAPTNVPAVIAAMRAQAIAELRR